MKTLLPLSLLLFIGGCNLLPSHVQQENHPHTTGELVDPNHHDMSNHHDMMNHTMDHAGMVTDELSFISEMIPHHQEAVDTSNALLTKTQNPQLKIMLQNIVSGQDKEITMMKGRLTDFYSGSDYKPMYMLMMRDTSAISAITTIEKMWLEDMIAHHQGAVDMAMKILAIMTQQDPLIKLSAEGNAHRNEVKAFAQAVIDSQTKEINQMKIMLQSY